MKRMIRRMLALLLPLALLLSVAAQAAGGDAEPRFRRTQTYDGRFADVSPEQWFYPYAAASYEYALIAGRPDGFAPNEPVQVAELLTLSARIRAAYEGDAIPAAAADEAWYAPYLAYLAARGLLVPTITDYDASATRAQLAAVFAATLPEDCFDNRNALLVTDAYASGAYIADVGEYTPYQPQILWMYRQGLLAGTDAAGAYRPEQTTTRAETATIVTRMVDPSLRITLGWTVLPPWSAAGRTLASLVEAPAAVPEAPDWFDADAMDALVRQMLAANNTRVDLRYPRPLDQSDAQALANAVTARVKSYCEQMYNSVVCTRYLGSGNATLRLSAVGCTDEQLARMREEAMARAAAIHDSLWETGQLTADMSQYEIARVLFLWLCDHCAYDWRGAKDDSSVSHLAYGALVDGRAVCDGYTGAYNLLLKLEGIDCRALANNEHIWTVATLDGTEYHIDVTWGDQSGYTDMQYFGMSAEASYRAHPW